MGNEILKLYNEVFDEKGAVRLCGRDKCIELIMAMGKRFPEVDFGNTTSGFMKIANIKKYINA